MKTVVRSTGTQAGLQGKIEKFGNDLEIPGVLSLQKISKHKVVEKHRETQQWSGLISQGNGVEYFLGSPESNAFLYNSYLL